MLTQCPACGTIYRLGAHDLSAAQGFVECGECDTAFNALERLADAPNFEPRLDEPPLEPSAASPAPSESGPSTVASDLPPHPELVDLDATVELQRPVDEAALELSTSAVTSDPSDAGAAEPIAQSVRSDAPNAGSFELPPADTLDLASLDNGSRAPSPTLSDEEHAILFTEPELEGTPPDEPSPPALDLDEVPAILQAEVAALQAPPPRRRAMLAWGLLATFLVVVLALQAAWVWRAQVRAALPHSSAWYEAACARLGCDAQSSSHPERIELVARDVRDHPRYRDTLLVNATLISRSEAISPFPVIQLGLHGEGGEVIGIRRFEPHEYLDVSIDLEAGMPPDRPVYIVLEIAQVSTRAVGFEFKFF